MAFLNNIFGKKQEAIITDNSDSNLASLSEREVLRFPDLRIKYEYTGGRAANPYRSAEIGAALATGTWLAFPSEDGYFCPWYLERMLKKADAENLDLVYCDTVIGNPWVHRCLSVQPVIGNIDKTSFVVRREWFCKMGGFNVENVGGPAPSETFSKYVGKVTNEDPTKGNPLDDDIPF